MNKKFIKLYVNFLKKILKPKRKLKVVFDCSNGTTWAILKHLKTKKLKAIFINKNPDGNFPAHGPNPLIPGAINQLKKEIIGQKADLGIIFDADGDRVFFIDNQGLFINPDIITRLLIWHLQPKKIIIDIRTGWLVKKFKNKNLQIITSRVGHYFIKKMMRKNMADFGAEISGHYYFKNFFYADSGILAAIEIINAVSRLPYSFSDFNNLLPLFYRSGEKSIQYQVLNIKHQKLLKKIEKYYNLKSKISALPADRYNLKSINHLDGLTMEFNDWWFNLRPSNTEPLIRLNVEATSKNLLDKSMKKIYSLIRT